MQPEDKQLSLITGAGLIKISASVLHRGNGLDRFNKLIVHFGTAAMMVSGVTKTPPLKSDFICGMHLIRLGSGWTKCGNRLQLV